MRLSLAVIGSLSGISISDSNIPFNILPGGYYQNFGFPRENHADLTHGWLCWLSAERWTLRGLVPGHTLHA
jgi:hypothetical protein